MMRFAGISLLLVACGTPAPTPTELSRLSLRSVLPGADPDVVGVTVDDDRVFVLDEASGLHRFNSDGTIQMVMGNDFLHRSWSGFTDIAAAGNGQFLITILNTGFRLNPSATGLERHFCYLPGSFEDEREQEAPVVQLTHSVAVDRDAGIIYAQPRTMEAADYSKIQSAQVGTFDLDSGDDTAWFELDDDEYLAGGMVALGDGRLLLAHGSEIDSYRIGGEIEAAYDLSELGVSEIRGLALNGDGSLIVLDGADDELVTVAR